METLVSLCKRRGFIFQSSEIYGGMSGCWDYGPIGVEMKRNIKDLWWKDVVQMHDNVVGMDGSIIMNPRIWEASGHVANFKDPMVDCKKCKRRFRADHLDDDCCPECGGELTDPRDFNLMFKTYVGAVEDDASVAYLRPETAQAIFAQFLTVQNVSRQRIPFGIAQMGKSFRNEVTPRNFIFRSREFEQMELEFFVEEGTDEEWNEYWVSRRIAWYHAMGIKPKRLRVRPHEKDELAHYAKSCVDIEYEFPFGWQELEGIANRSDFDLRQHQEFSGKKLVYRDELSQKEFIPWVIETSAGVDRILLTLLADAYAEEEVQGEKRVVLRFTPQVAPIKAAIFPLSKKPALQDLAQKVEKSLREHTTTFYDEIGSIGKRYRRQDEIGTPFCITIDFESLEDNAGTVRFRDSMRQERISLDNMVGYIAEQVKNATT
ncbi:MAG: glycine--tRNA ligase [bacterium]|nr:glycine--tRNA ligase [bacterium]